MFFKSYSYIGEVMHLYKTMRNFLMDFDYYIDLYEEKIHVFNYIDIVKLTDEEIVLAMPAFTLTLKGTKFVVKRLEKREILIEGTLEDVRFQR